jgi:hypothetical protein
MLRSRKGGHRLLKDGAIDSAIAGQEAGLSKNVTGQRRQTMNKKRIMLTILIVGLALAATPGPYAAQAARSDRPLATLGHNAGAVNVLYGQGSSGLAAANNQLWHQDVNGVTGEAAAGDNLGWALAVGDFDGDTFPDLAVGVPHKRVNNHYNAGEVHILYGSSSRLTATDNQVWQQGNAGLVDAAEDADEFGSALAAGDFNGDGRDDLAVGIPYEDVGTLNSAGAVQILYGSAGGLTATGNQFWHQNSTDVEGTAEESDHFGYALAAGDFNGDGRDDLAVGVPDEDVGTINNTGVVNVLYGSGSGLTAAGDQMWAQGSGGLVNAAEENDTFGKALAAGDFNGDGRDDLAVGVPGEDVGTTNYAGAVHVVYGSANGLAATNNYLWYQNVSGMEDTSEANDLFGWALAAGNFNGDSRDDLAVGVPGEAIGNISAGAVHVLYGSASGLSAATNKLWHQDVLGVADVAEGGDQFGYALAAGDFNGDGRDDLAVGVPDEGTDAPKVMYAGAVNVLYGSASGLTSTGNQIWYQDSPGILDKSEESDQFGYALAAGDFNHGGAADLAVGVPYENIEAHIYLPIIQRNN